MDIGVIINQYEIVEHIGRGGMADVWSARDRRLNRMVAIKTVAHSLSQDAAPLNMFKKEAQTIARMEHPHILPIYDFGEYEGQLYIVMRYVAGGSLDDIIRRGPLPINEALRLGQAIAQALDYAHAGKVVHLDLKPPNVLLDSHRSPYLADFGLATVLDPEGKATNPGSGTLLYMAPEQLTSDVIDYRADLYSFAIVMFHMLTGKLPFEGSAPLALKQMQFQEDLPPLDSVNSTIPLRFTTILRKATAVEPSERYNTLMDVIDELQAVYLDTIGIPSGTMPLPNVAPTDEPLYKLPVIEGLDGEILEAVDIYTRARHNWAGGNGRFLLGVTNYMVMNGYYMNAEQHRLELDNAGIQMLLRGALEYDHEINFWWNRLTLSDQRWVCLHALRSGSALARVRALYRLETLPDAEPSIIPKLVAQMLQIETNEEARIAALQVFDTRHRLSDATHAYTGRLLTAQEREHLHTTHAPANWQETVYTPEIDILLAETAFDTGTPRVSEFAARVVGRMRSISAVRHIANQQREGRHGGLRALAFVRDEAPSLPDVVGTGGRIYAWITNSLHRLLDNPLGLFLRFTTALIGAGLAMGIHIWTTFIGFNIFTPQRWINTLAVGLLFGFAVAILVMVVGEFSSRLRGFWPAWVRGLLTGAFGAWWATRIWYQFTWGYLQDSPVDWSVMTFGGLGLMAGFLLTALFNLRSYVSIPLTALLIYLPINITYFVGRRFVDVAFFRPSEAPTANPFEFSQSILPYGNMFPTNNGYQWLYGEQIYTVGITFALLIAVGGHFIMLVDDIRIWLRHMGNRYLERVPIGGYATHPPTLSTDTVQLETLPEAQHIKTELDVNQAIQKVEERDTELDINLGKGQSNEEETAPQRVNIRTGIRVDDIKPPDKPNN
jgi:hypothetical protein